jgi:cytochrome bd-type quinol oxidase subunit 2
LIFIGLAAAVAIWGGWVHLGELTGFGPINLLPGVGGGFTLNTAVVLPLSVELYSAYALRVLLASDQLSERSRRFARRSFLASLAVGGGAQIASHIMVATHVASAPWPVTTVVACVPLLVIGLATGLATLVKQDANAGSERHSMR